MIRLTWRQFRTEAVAAAAVLVVLAVVLAVTGPHLVSVRDDYLAFCKKGGCPATTDPVVSTYTQIQTLLKALVLVAPALIGVFWGAPLVARELETGTFRLAWTQSVTRHRWLAVKLGVVGLASMAAAGLLSLMVTWWYSPIEAVLQNRFDPAPFGLLGLVPVGYAAFAFALGVTAGLLFRRTLPAMAVTLAGYVGGRLAVTYWVRPHLATPVRASHALSGAGVGISKTPAGLSVVPAIGPSATPPDAWVYSARVVGPAGHPPSSAAIQASCSGLLKALPGAPVGSAAGAVGGVQRRTPGPGGPALQEQFRQCADRLAARYHVLVTYQPGSRYWPFQWAETGIFVAAALVLAAACFWWVRHRVA